MLRYIISNRMILSVIVFSIVALGCSLLHSWHTQRTIDAESTQIDEFLEQLHNERDGKHTENQNDHISPRTVTSEFESTNPVDDTENLEVAADLVSVKKIDEEVPVSPFGFGQYPEIPDGYYGTPSWLWDEEYLAKLESILTGGLKSRGLTFDDHLRISELMSRVGIKLFNEGVNFSGMTSSDETGLFYPNEPNVIYVVWGETKGPNGGVRQYISASKGSAVAQLSMSERLGYEPIPDWIEVRSFEDGIDPYEYLGLSR